MESSRDSISIKRIMLIHDHIFKQQVKELHRLYNLQRKLMLELKNEMSKIEDPRVLHMNNTSLNFCAWQQPRRELGFNSINLYGLTDDQKEERSGSFSGEKSKILIPIRGLNLEMAADEEGTSTSNYEHEKSRKLRSIEETDVELTLSIGPKWLKSHKEKEISFSTSAKLEECGDGTSSSATFNKETAIQALLGFPTS